MALAVQHRRLDLFWLAVDLAVPPMSLLALGLASAICIAWFAWLCGASIAPLAICGGASLLLMSAVLCGWAVHCRQQAPLRALIAAPFYIVMKLPIYVAFLVRPQQRWLRTERDIART